MNQFHRPLRPWLPAAALAIATAGVPPALSAQVPPGGREAEGSAASDRPQVSVSGHVDRDAAGTGDAVSFWVSFANDTAEPITDLEIVRLHHPGFQETGTCWQDHVPACGEDGVSPPPVILQPGERAIFTAELQPVSRQGKVTLTALHRWRAGGGPFRRGVTMIGAVELVGGWRDLYWWVELLKDLAWPLVLLALGGLLKSGEQRRTEIQQTWTQMLQKSHENAERYYMPISSQILRLRRELAALDEAKKHVDAPGQIGATARRKLEVALNRVCEELLILLRRHRELVDRIGGWYFKSRSGEDLVAYTWRCFLVTAQARLDRETLGRVLDGLSVKDSPTQVARKLATKLAGDGSEIRKNCRTWVLDRDFGDVFCLLRLLEVLLDFEMNRCYERWYGHREAFPETDLAEATAAFHRWAGRLPAEETAQRQGAVDIASRLAEYPRQVRRQHGRIARLRGHFARWQDWVDRQGTATP